MSSAFQGSYYPSIRDSTVIVNTTNQTTSPTGFERLIQAVAPNAFHNSDDRPDPPKCHENTRVAVINKIMEWVTGKIDTDAFMLWLYGPAGAGKSAIARTLAELCAAQGLLLASFLFFRSDPKRNTIKPLVANIAYCVGRVIPGAGEPINTVIEADPLILSYTVEAQLTRLVLEPLRLLADQGHFLRRPFPRLIIIDGLDECLDKDAQTNLIRLLSSSTARYQLQLKFLIASRPEAHIKSAIAIARDKSNISHLELNKDFKPDEDIHRFLTDKFREIQMCHPLRSQIPSFWPGERKINELVRKASGQFIYASLAARFANSPGHSPRQRLDIVLELRPPTHRDLPFAELDTLYTYILSCSYDPDLVRRILGVHHALLAIEMDGIDIVEDVLGLEDGEVRVYLSALSSILEVETQYGSDTIIFHHSSFMDFLHTPERSKDYFVDAREMSTLIVHCIMEGFTRNECSVSRRGRWNIRIDGYLTEALWTVELERAVENFSFGNYVEHLLEHRYDWWILNDLIKIFFDRLETEKSEFLHNHSAAYLEYVTSSIESHPSAEKFHLLSTVWFVLQEPCKSYLLSFPDEIWDKLCTTLFGFDSRDVTWDFTFHYLMRHPRNYNSVRATLKPLRAIYGHIAETTRVVPQPILSHRLACVAISCIQYLRCRGLHAPPKRDHLRAWAMKSKQLPWMWRRRMQVVSGRRGWHPLWREAWRQPLRRDAWKLYSFPSCLRRLRQILHCKGIQSEKVYREAHIMYMWTLDLLYRTLLKARKSDELTNALSESFIHWPAPILLPRHVKRVRKAIDAYLKKFGPSLSERFERCSVVGRSPVL